VFGAALGSYQLTQVRIAQMAALYVACRHLAFVVGKQLDEGGNSADASLVKLIACRAAERITRDALQIHGGMGYAEETAVSRYWIDARVLSIFEGAEETLALKVVARGLLEEALRRVH
jgi:(2S)-methylsuccinyl-CoA dehydrogenase